jgi:hypothetical protein
MAEISGASAELFDAQVRLTITRKLERLDTDELLGILGRMILAEREKSAETESQPPRLSLIGPPNRPEKI